jgi:hypothetical protein
MWVTPTYKTKGIHKGRNQEMSQKISDALEELRVWGTEYNVVFQDLHSENYGLDDEGNLVFYDFDVMRV